MRLSGGAERPGTRAANQLPDDIPFETKKRRNNELLSVQNRISEQDNERFLGQTVAVLVEGPSKRFDKQNEEPVDLNGPIQLTGRTHDDRIVVFVGSTRLVGEIIPIGIYEVSGLTLLGTVVTDHVTGPVVTLA